MKKLLAFILCLTMAMGAVAFAEEVTGTELNKDVLEGQTTVSLTVNPEDNEFVVVIPASVTIDPSTKEGTFDVVLKSGWKLVSCNGLRVRIKEFANGVAKEAPYFTLKNSDGTSVGYSIYQTSPTSSRRVWLGLETAYPSGSDDHKAKWDEHNVVYVTRTQSNQTDVTKNYCILLSKLPTEPGEYTDIITFSIELS